MGGGLFTFFDDELTAYSNKKLSRNNNCRLLASHGERLFRSTVCVCGGGVNEKVMVLFLLGFQMLWRGAKGVSKYTGWGSS